MSLPSSEPVRLSKRVAELMRCSRREAELYIEGGWVSVDGAVVEQPQFRVQDQRVEVSPEARPEALGPVTLLLHKPAGAEAGLGRLPQSQPAASWLTPEHAAEDMGRPLLAHLRHQELVAPLAPRASGLVVFTQDGRIARKLREDALLLEHEVLVQVSGTPTEGALERLNRPDHGLALDGRLLGPCKVSWQNETTLRFALKGERPGQLAFFCEHLGLAVQGMRRIRIGRVALARLPVGQWRYLLPHERF